MWGSSSKTYDQGHASPQKSKNWRRKDDHAAAINRRQDWERKNHMSMQLERKKQRDEKNLRSTSSDGDSVSEC